MGLFYQQFECSVILDDRFLLCGVWCATEMCRLSYPLCGCLIDRIMRRTMADRTRGIEWTLFSQLEDLDPADDLAALFTTRCLLWEKTARLSRCVKQVGLSINASMTLVMCINAIPGCTY